MCTRILLRLFPVLYGLLCVRLQPTTGIVNPTSSAIPAEFSISGRFYMYLTRTSNFYIPLLLMVVKKPLIIFPVNNVRITPGPIGFPNSCYNLMLLSRHRVEWYEFTKKCVLLTAGNILPTIDRKFACQCLLVPIIRNYPML